MAHSKDKKTQEPKVKTQKDIENRSESNCWLYFDCGKKLQLKAIGLHGLFCGYLTFVRGNFEFTDLQDVNYMSSRIFAFYDDILNTFYNKLHFQYHKNKFFLLFDIWDKSLHHICIFRIQILYD